MPGAMSASSNTPVGIGVELKRDYGGLDADLPMAQAEEASLKRALVKVCSRIAFLQHALRKQAFRALSAEMMHGLLT